MPFPTLNPADDLSHPARAIAEAAATGGISAGLKRLVDVANGWPVVNFNAEFIRCSDILKLAEELEDVNLR